MIGWGGNGFPGMPEVDATLWQSRGFGGYKTSVNFLNDFGGGQNRFRGSSARHERIPRSPAQKRIEQSFHPTKFGCEGYVGCKFRNATRPYETVGVRRGGPTRSESLFATRMGELAAFCQFHRLAGLSADTEQGFWGLNYVGNEHSDEENMARIESWGYRTGQAVFDAMPNCIMLIYNWIPPGGFAFEEVYRPDPTVDRRVYHADDSSHPTTLWYQSEAVRAEAPLVAGLRQGHGRLRGPVRPHGQPQRLLLQAGALRRCGPERRRTSTRRRAAIAHFSKRTLDGRRQLQHRGAERRSMEQGLRPDRLHLLLLGGRRPPRQARLHAYRVNPTTRTSSWRCGSSAWARDEASTSTRARRTTTR